MKKYKKTIEQRAYLAGFRKLHKQHELKIKAITYDYLKELKGKLIDEVNTYGVEHTLNNLDYLTKFDSFEQTAYNFLYETGDFFAKNNFDNVIKQVNKLSKKSIDPLQVGFHSHLWVSKMREFAKNEAGTLITRLSGSTRQWVRQQLDKAIEDKLGNKGAVKLLKTNQAFSLTRAKRIARTETTRAAESGQYFTALSFGDTLVKAWLAFHDSRTRHEHATADGQVVGMNEYFNVGGEKMLYPGDLNASAENTIHCRCTIMYQVKPNSQGVNYLNEIIGIIASSVISNSS